MNKTRYFVFEILGHFPALFVVTYQVPGFLHKCTMPTFVLAIGLASVIPTFCIGLMSGAPGGLLWGAAAVVLLQSLELLADNRLLMNHLEKYSYSVIMDYNHSEIVHEIHTATSAEMFGVFSSTLSLAVGLYIGLSTYSLVIKKKGEAAMGKAMVVAGPVCLMVVTATGYMLGLTFESFLSITSIWSIFLLFLMSAVIAWPFQVINDRFSDPSSNLLCFVLPFITCYSFFLSCMFSIRLSLSALLLPTIVILKFSGNPLRITAVTVPLMLLISDIYNIAGQQIVSLQSPTPNNTSSIILEDIFVGVLSAQLWMVAIGMSLFVSLCPRGGAGKICASAVSSGAAVLGAIKLALPVLGPGPTIGALMGVAGAVGVSLSAAGATTDPYGRVVGWLGVIVGAAAGAFLSSCAHSGLSGIFMGLCAATIPGGVLFVQFLFSTSYGFSDYLFQAYALTCLVIIVFAVCFYVWQAIYYILIIHTSVLWFIPWLPFE